MKRASICTVVLVSLLALSGLSLAEDQPQSGENAMPEMGSPKEMKQVEHLVGTWDVTGKYQMDPTQDWQEFTGSCEFTMKLGGSALMMNFTSEMMGMPYQGMGIQCYDRESKEWQNLWVDNTGGRMSLFTGNMEGDKMVMSGTEKWQGKSYPARVTTYNMKDDSFDWKYEASMDGGKSYTTSMEMHYVKKK